MPTPLRDIRDALLRSLRSVSGVGAVAVAWTPGGERCLRVSVSPQFRDGERIPSTFRGVPVVVQTASAGQLQSAAEGADG